MVKQIFYIAIWLIGFLSLASCRPQYATDTQLVLADSLMKEHPDSALHLLESIKPLQLKSKADNAYYALLLTQARDKNYIIQTDDSLIQTAVEYYDSVKDIPMQAKAYYYKGCIYRNANMCGEAVKEYLTAIPLAQKAQDKELLGLIYNHTGYLYYLQDLIEQASLIYQSAEKLAIQQRDSCLWAESLLWQGRINTEKGITYHPDAEQKLLKAFEIAINPKYKRIQANVAASLSKLYNRMNQCEKAILFAKQNISLRDDTIHCYRAYLLLGNAYYKALQYDSAHKFLTKSLSSNLYEIKANAYMQLSAIAKATGKLDESLALTEKYMMYVDSINLSKQSNEIIKAEKKVEKQKYIDSLKQHHSKHIVSIIIIAILACTIGVICFILKKGRHKTYKLKQESLNSEHERQELHKKYMQLKSDLIEKDTIIASLQASINQQHANDEKKKKLQQELDIFSRERDALAKETFEHSKIYAKIERIIDACKKYESSNEYLNEDDWKYLLAEIDMRWDGAITRLSSKYQLSKKEIHLCCLFLTDISTSNFKYIIEYTRSSIYRKEKEILELMGYSPKSNKLKDILKKV